MAILFLFLSVICISVLFENWVCKYYNVVNEILSLPLSLQSLIVKRLQLSILFSYFYKLFIEAIFHVITGH